MDFINLYIITATVFLLSANIAVTINGMQKVGLPKESSLSVATLGAATLGVAGFLISLFAWYTPDITVTAQPGYLSCSYGMVSVLVLGLTFLVLISVKPYILKETAFLILLSMSGILLMAASTTLIGFYLALELISLSSYILASTSISRSAEVSNDGHRSYDPYSSVSHKHTIVGGLKYFLLSALSSGLLVLGISLIYYSTGVLEFSSLARIVETYINNSSITEGSDQSYPQLFLGVSLMVAFVLFKLGSAPFHYWVADVYEKVNVLVNYYLIAVAKVGMVFALLKLTFAFPLMYYFCIISSVASLLVGSFAGLVQSKLRRLMAYSSINHVGYMVLALSLSGVTLSSVGVNLSLGISETAISELMLYIAIYSISTVTFFTIFFVSIENGVESQPAETNPTLTRYGSFNAIKGNFYISASLTITLLSLAGVPPLGGFMAKIAIFWQILDSGNWFLATAAVACSVIAAVYYLRVIKCIYFNSPYKSVPGPKPLKLTFITALIISATSLSLVAYPVLYPSVIFIYFNSF